MKIIHLNTTNISYWKEHSKPSVMALGFFDGVHRGHTKVIETAGEIAKEQGISHTVMSFFPHPKTVIGKSEKEFDYLMPLSKKASILEALGVDIFYIVEFNKAFLSLLPEEFITGFLVDMKVKHAVAGFDFTYGYRGIGNIERLRADSRFQIDVTKVDEIAYAGEKISSTRMRDLIHHGRMEELVNYLGRRYETEMYWDGTCLKPSPYYMLPAQGIYRALFRMNGRLQKKKIFVPPERNAVYLIESTTHQFDLSKTVEIIWLTNVAREKVMHGSQSFLVTARGGK